MAAYDQASSIFSAQWMLEEIQVVNWGCFDGIVRVPFATVSRLGDDGAVNLITGASGSGKSTLNDLHNEVMRPAGVKREYNKSSGEGGGRSKERTLIKYVLGLKKGCIGRLDHPEEFLRDPNRNNWSGGRELYVSTTGDRLSICKLFYYRSGADAPKEYYLISSSDMDLERLNSDNVSGVQWRREDLKGAFGDDVLIFDRLHDYGDAIQRLMSVGRTEEDYRRAAKLYAKVSNASTVTDVDETYREFIMPPPRTFATAEHAVETWDKETKTLETMHKMRRMLDALRVIRDNDALFVKAAGDIESYKMLFGAEDGAMFRAYGAHRFEAGFRSAMQSARDAADARARALSEAQARYEAADARSREVAELYREKGGNMLERAKEALARAEQREALVSRRRETLANALAGASLPVPESEEELANLRRDVEAEIASGPQKRERLQSELEGLAVEAASAAAEVKELEGKIDRMRGKKTMLAGTSYDVARDLISDATGLPSDDMVFAGELVDIADDANRKVVNAGLADLACTLLVDSDELPGVVAAADELDIAPRIRCVGVEPIERAMTVTADGRLSSVLRFDETSRFAGFVAHVISESYDPMLVESVEAALAESEAGGAITPSGSLVETENAAAFGLGGGEGWDLIGFDNAKKVAALKNRLEELGSRRAELDARRRELNGSISSLNDMLRALASAEGLLQTIGSYTDIDADAAIRGRKDAEERIRELVQDNDLDALRKQMADAQAARDTALQEKGKAEGDKHEADVRVGSLASVLSELDGELATVTSVVVNDDAAAWADAHGGFTTFESEFFALGQRYAVPGAWTNYGKTMVSLKNKLRAARDEQVEVQRRCKAQLDKSFLEYRDLRGDDTVGLPIVYSDAGDAYPYLQALEQLEKKQVGKESTERTQRRIAVRNTSAVLADLRSAFDQDVRLIKQEMTQVDEIISQYDYDDDGGRLHINVEDVSRSRSRTWTVKSKLTGKSGSDIARFSTWDVYDDDLDWEAAYKQVGALVSGTLERCLRTPSPRELDSRFDVQVRIIRKAPDGTDEPDQDLTELGSMSGGEKQKLNAFVIAAALMYYVGANAENKPSYAPIFFDEAFIKSDYEHTVRPIQLLNRMGFQVVLLSPFDKTQEIEPVADNIVNFAQAKDTGTTALVDCDRERYREVFA